MTPRVRTRKKTSLLLRVACLILEIKESRCYEAKIEESERPAVTSGRALAAQARGVLGRLSEHWRLKPEVSWVDSQNKGSVPSF